MIWALWLILLRSHSENRHFCFVNLKKLSFGRRVKSFRTYWTEISIESFLLLVRHKQCNILKFTCVHVYSRLKYTLMHHSARYQLQWCFLLTSLYVCMKAVNYESESMLKSMNVAEFVRAYIEANDTQGLKQLLS